MCGPAGEHTPPSAHRFLILEPFHIPEVTGLPDSPKRQTIFGRVRLNSRFPESSRDALPASPPRIAKRTMLEIWYCRRNALAHCRAYSPHGTRLAAAAPASLPVIKAERMPDPVNGSTNPSASPALYPDSRCNGCKFRENTSGPVISQSMHLERGRTRA